MAGNFTVWSRGSGGVHAQRRPKQSADHIPHVSQTRPALLRYKLAAPSAYCGSVDFYAGLSDRVFSEAEGADRSFSNSSPAPNQQGAKSRRITRLTCHLFLP